MHFIQNSWFVVYSVWLLLLLISSIGVISYINNRMQFLRRIALYFSVTLVAAVSMTLHTDREIFTSKNSMSITRINSEESEVETPSILNNAFRFLGSLLRDRIEQ